MKASAKNLAKVMLETAKTKGAKNAARGVFSYLLKHNQLKILPQVLAALDQISDEAGETIVRIYSKTSVSEAQAAALRQKLSREFNIKNAIIENITDPILIGGVKITFRDKIIDQTIKSKINQLAMAISK